MRGVTIMRIHSSCYGFNIEMKTREGLVNDNNNIRLR